MKNKIKLFTGLIMFLGCLAWGISIALSNIDMTEMRLLITYWKEYLVMFVFMMLGYYLITSANKKKR